MAPLTRLRSIEPGDIPTPLMGEYYRQRAGAGLIISEATQISAQAKGYAGARSAQPEQIAASKKSRPVCMTQAATLLSSCGIQGGFLITAFSGTTGSGSTVCDQCRYPHLTA